MRPALPVGEEVYTPREPRPPRAGYNPDDEGWEYINADGTPDRAMLQRVVDAIVARLQPEKIVLFGSAARGEMTPESDIDLLVVGEGLERERRRTTGQMYAALPSERRSVDLILVCQEEIELNRGKSYFVVGQAMEEGQVLYDRETA